MQSRSSCSKILSPFFICRMETKLSTQNMQAQKFRWKAKIMFFSRQVWHYIILFLAPLGNSPDNLQGVSLEVSGMSWKSRYILGQMILKPKVLSLFE